MNRLIDLVLFVIVVGILWWALKAILLAFGIGEPWMTLAVVLFVVGAVVALVDYWRGGSWFFNR